MIAVKCMRYFVLTVLLFVAACQLRAPGPALPGSVTFHHSGEGTAVRQGTLMEYTWHPPESWPDTEPNVILMRSGVEAERLAMRPVFRPGHKRSYVAHSAALNEGPFVWQLEDGASGILIDRGAFHVFREPIESSGQTVSPPFPSELRLLYDNDPTLTTSPTYPGVLTGGGMGEQIRHTVAQTALVNGERGSHGQILTPSFTWVPWWPSRFYPVDQHLEWFHGLFGDDLLPERLTEYAANGGDLIADFLAACETYDQASFLSFRLNDHHLLDEIESGVTRWFARHLSQFYWEYPEYHLGSIESGSYGGAAVLNWAFPAVPAHMLSFIHELVRDYPFEGLQLDFMRHYRLFSDDTPMDMREEIVTRFIKDVRDLLDAYPLPDRGRWLMLRIPLSETYHPRMGLNLDRLVEAGVNALNLSASYYTMIQGDFAAMASRYPDMACFLEMHFTTSGPANREDIDWGRVRQLTRDEQFFTGAHLAYARGLQGVSLFNLGLLHGGRRDVKQGYRDQSVIPFHILPCLGIPSCVANQPMHYFKSRVPAFNFSASADLANRATVLEGGQVELEMDMAPPASGWPEVFQLRFHARRLDAATRWRVFVNEHELTPIEGPGKTYPTPHPEGFGPPAEYLAWTGPGDLLIDGINRIRIELVDGPLTRIGYIEMMEVF